MSSNRLEMLIAVAAICRRRNWTISQRKKYKKLLLLLALKPTERRWWVRPTFQKRVSQGDTKNMFDEMRLSDKESFFNFFQMTPETFDELLSLIGPLIQKRDSNFRDCISPKERLSVTLRYLASGDLMSSLSSSFRIARSTISVIIRETTSALINVLQPIVLETPTEEKYQQIADEFDEMWQFPHCLGALGGKHVAMQTPTYSASVNSIVLLAVCDAKYKFTIVDMGVLGSQSDGGIFSASAFGQALDAQKLPIPKDEALTTDVLPYSFVADAAFPLKTHLLRPFPRQGFSGKISEAISKASLEEKIFNYRLSRAQRCIENAFGIMSSRFRIFHRAILASLGTCGDIVKASICLHNFLMDKSEYCPHEFGDHESSDGVLIPGLWREETPAAALTKISSAGSNMYSRNAAESRNCFKRFFCNEGAVSWQLNQVEQTS